MRAGAPMSGPAQMIVPESHNSPADYLSGSYTAARREPGM